MGLLLAKWVLLLRVVLHSVADVACSTDVVYCGIQRHPVEDWETASQLCFGLGAWRFISIANRFFKKGLHADMWK